jgi:hypothetical protein
LRGEHPQFFHSDEALPHSDAWGDLGQSIQIKEGNEVSAKTRFMGVEYSWNYTTQISFKDPAFSAVRQQAEAYFTGLINKAEKAHIWNAVKIMGLILGGVFVVITIAVSNTRHLTPDELDQANELHRKIQKAERSADISAQRSEKRMEDQRRHRFSNCES